MSVLESAISYRRRNWFPIPIPLRSKNPGFKGWDSLRLSESEIQSTFGGAPQNLGVLLGEPSGWLIDTDLDAAEAVAIADLFLPRTGSEFGRASKPRSHRLYRSTGSITTKFQYGKKPNGGMIVEIRSTGAQTVFPPSLHESNEAIEWVEDNEPTVVEFSLLHVAVSRLAAAALIARFWPKGSRHDAALALAGGLLRANWSKDDAKHFIRAVCKAAGDVEVRDRLAAVETSTERLKTSASATGWPSLARLIGKEPVNWVLDTLGIGKVDLHDVPHYLPSPDGKSAPLEKSEEWEPPLPLEHGRLPEFPLDRMPQQLCGFCGYCAMVAHSLQVPVDLIVMLALSVIAYVLSKRVEIHVRADFYEPVNLYVVVALPPAERKSAALREVAGPLEAMERRDAIRMAPDIAHPGTASG